MLFTRSTCTLRATSFGEMPSMLFAMQTKHTSNVLVPFHPDAPFAWPGCDPVASPSVGGATSRRSGEPPRQASDRAVRCVHSTVGRSSDGCRMPLRSVLLVPLSTGLHRMYRRCIVVYGQRTPKESLYRRAGQKRNNNLVSY